MNFSFVVFSLMAGATVASAQSMSLPANPIVAVVDGKPVLESELLSMTQPALSNLRKQEYEIKRQALDWLIGEKMIAAEAARRGITVEELTRQEIDAKTTEPAAEDVERYYASRPEQAKPPLDKVRDQIAKYLKAARQGESRQAFMATLQSLYTTRVLLDPLRTQVASDPARTRGPADAVIKIVEFSDFQCPFCRNAEKAIQALVDKYPDKVSIAYRDFPLTAIHSNANPAAEASRCAADQGKFWEYHDRLFQTKSLDGLGLKQAALDLSLDADKFDACVDKANFRAAVESDIKDAQAVGVRGTPTFFVNGIQLVGNQPLSAFEELIDQELVRAEQARMAAR
jgi:protein-disulfide isomerase